jgi:hypothetical protein
VPSKAAVGVGEDVLFTVSLTNLRERPLQFGWDRAGCFSFADIGAPLPLEPVGRTDWTGAAAAFKAQVLSGGPSEHVYLEPAASTRLLAPDCVEVDGVADPLAPGETTATEFRWTAAFGAALPDPPASATFQAIAYYSTRDTLVTVPPPPTTCPCGRWYPNFQELRVVGTIGITGATRSMASLGQLVDGALADGEFATFVHRHPVVGCIVNLSLPDDQGRYLPAGPGWNLEELCLDPRRFIRLELDPWTAEVKGVDVCNVACWR